MLFNMTFWAPVTGMRGGGEGVVWEADAGHGVNCAEDVRRGEAPLIGGDVRSCLHDLYDITGGRELHTQATSLKQSPNRE